MSSLPIPVGECAPEPCSFPRVEIGDEYADPSGILLPGMEVLLPCEGCGVPAIEFMDWIEGKLIEAEQGIKLLQSHKNVPLFHWSPAKNRNQIVRYGLKPGRRPTTHSDVKWRAPYTCFADDPAWAWALSGGQKHSPDGEWDLWQTWFNDLTEPEVLASSDGNGIHEYRTGHRVFKRSLKYLGSRTKE